MPAALARSRIASTSVADVDRHGVEKARRWQRKPSSARPAAQVRPPRWMRCAICRQAFRPVVDRVHRGHHRQQHLRGADVRGRLFAADVLLARLQRQAVGTIAALSMETPTRRPGNGALQTHPQRHVGRRAARHSPSARRSAASSRQRCRHRVRPAMSAASAPAVGRENRDAAGCLHRRDHLARITDRAARCRDTGTAHRKPASASGPCRDHRR